MLTSAVQAGDTKLMVSIGTAAKAGDVVQIGHEVMVVSECGRGLRWEVTVRRSIACRRSTSRNCGITCCCGAPTSCRSYESSSAAVRAEHTIIRSSAPDVRIAAAELFVTNDRGQQSGVALRVHVDGGCGNSDALRRPVLHPGGRDVIASNDAAPPLMVEDSHAVRDTYAVLREPPRAAIFKCA